MKKKLFMITLAVCLIVLSIASTSLAYFTDTEKKATVFTAGNVEIALSLDDLNELKLFPGQEYTKSAAISNIGSENAYVGAIIRLRGASINSVLAPTSAAGNVPVAISSLLNGLDASDYVVKYKPLDNGYDIFVVKKTELAGKTDTANASATIFSKICIPKEWDNAQMGAIKGASIEIIAYATQTVGFRSENNLSAAENALKAAFGSAEGDAWYGYPTT